jgi:hypothetical protein
MVPNVYWLWPHAHEILLKFILAPSTILSNVHILFLVLESQLSILQRRIQQIELLDDKAFRDADTFASDALAMAERNGSIDRNYDTWEAVRSARAYLDGERFYIDPELAELDKHPCELQRW